MPHTTEEHWTNLKETVGIWKTCTFQHNLLKADYVLSQLYYGILVVFIFIHNTYYR